MTVARKRTFLEHQSEPTLEGNVTPQNTVTPGKKTKTKKQQLSLTAGKCGLILWHV